MQSIFNNFQITELNIILGITGVFITVFTLSAVQSHIKIRAREYYLNLLFCSISFLILIFTKNWMIFYIVWEFVTITTSLMLLWRGKGLAGQYFLIQFLGGSILFLAILLGTHYGYTEIMPIKESWLQNLFILGIGIKSSLFGFHFWVPSVYLQAPVPFNAISSGWIAKLGFILMLKIIPEGNQLLLFLGFMMIFYGGVKALGAVDFKLLLTYSSISQFGFIALGIASGTIYGYLGSVIHIIAHGFAKTGLFLACGNLIKEYGSRSIYEFKDVWQRQRLSSIIILISFSSLMGIPLLAGFNSKYLIKYGFTDGFIMTILLYTASILTSLYSLRFLYLGIFKDFFGSKKAKDSLVKKNYNPGKVEYIVFIVIAVLLLMVGFTGEIIIRIVANINFTFSPLMGLLEIIVYLVISLIILEKGVDWLKNQKMTKPSLDHLFNRINKGLYYSGRYLYNVLYKDFQYQLLGIPLFIIILFFLSLL